MLLALLAAASAVPTTSVGVGLDEFGVAAYRRTVVPGVVKLNVTNLGEDQHDLALRTPGGRILARTAVLLPGERTTVRVRLRGEATHTLVCTLADHEKRGMRARITVRRKRSR
jgi:hypothetical protein